MTDSIIELSEDAFAALFPLRTNHLNPGASWEHPDGGGCLFETYGDEFAYAEQCDNRTIWTLADDGDGKPCLLSSFHFVNRVGYLVSMVPVPPGVQFRVKLDAGKHDLFRPARQRVKKAALVIADYGLGDELENLTDLLTDARHWCDEHDVDFAELDRLAYQHYIAERNNEED